MSLRGKIGAAIFDAPRSIAQLLRSEGWARVVNRSDSYSCSQDPFGVQLNSESTSSIHLCDMFPTFGRWLLQKAIGTWEFRLAETVDFSGTPQISFVIPHRGCVRQPLLEATIRSIASLPGAVECIVVEQDETKKLESLPGNTRHIHAPHPSNDQGWHKCYAFNVGVRAAKADIVVCHDGDVLVPTGYWDVIRRHLVEHDTPVAYTQRFLFYLSRGTTDRILDKNSTTGLAHETPECVKQNWTGGTLAITKNAYWEIGGFDESFTGWTGEDREFYDRCKAIDGWFHGYVPFLHLWHPPQTGRSNADERIRAAQFTRDRLSIDRGARIATLVERQVQA